MAESTKKQGRFAKSFIENNELVFHRMWEQVPCIQQSMVFSVIVILYVKKDNNFR